MSPRPQSRPQRKGTRTSYLKQVASRNASQEERAREALAVWADEGRLARMADSVVVTALMGRAECQLTLPQLASTDPMTLFETRRPASWTERTNRTTLVVIKNGSTRYHVWAESLNERSHMWDMLVGLPQARLVTQMLRLSWRAEDLSVQHYPDFLWWQGAAKSLVDVTSQGRRRPTQTLAWELTARLCEQLGWGYEVRLPMSRQRAQNLGSLDFASDVDQATVVLAGQIDADVGDGGVSLYRVIRRFGGTGVSPLLASLHLVANGRLHLDWDDPIRSSTRLCRQSPSSSAQAPAAHRARWLRDFTKSST